MFEWSDDPGLVALLAADEAEGVGRPEVSEPVWSLDWDDAAAVVCDGQRVTGLAGRPPSVLGVQALAFTDPGVLRHDELIDYLVLVQAHKAWLDEFEQRALASLDTNDTSALKWSVEEVMCALRISSRAARRSLATAKTLTRDLPQTITALSSGSICAGDARSIAAASWKLPPDVTPDFEDRVVSQAAAQTPGELRRSLQRAVISLDPATAQQRHELAVEDREVSLNPLPDGMASMPVVLRAVDAEAVYTRLSGAARLLPADDPRSMDQKRADLLVDAVLAAIAHDALPELQGRRPQVNIHVGLSTLLGCDDEPGWLDGHGPVTAAEARRIAHHADGVWRRLVTDPVDGQILDVGRRSYRPPRALADHVLARDSECAFPSCHQPGYRCDIDHIHPWDQGGTTCPGNHAPTCRRHHRCKTLGPFRYRRNPDGSYTWNLGGRHEYTSTPPVKIRVPADEEDISWNQRLDQLRHERETERRRAEDTNHTVALNAITRDLNTATESGDIDWHTRAQQALTELHTQRTQQLQRRTDHTRQHEHGQATTTPHPITFPDEPPF
jgi:hypothetical protein